MLVVSLAVLALPTILWFINRHNNDFSRQIKIVALVYLVYCLASWIVIPLVTNLYYSLKYGLGIGYPFANFFKGYFGSGSLLALPFVLLLIYSVWKMKAGTTFGSLFKKPATVSRFLFIVYLLVPILFIIPNLILLLNYIIFTGIAVFLIWLLFFKLDILSMGFGSNGSSSESPPHQCCASCSKNINGHCCGKNPHLIADPLAATDCEQYMRG
jgi:hypothetical protein